LAKQAKEYCNQVLDEFHFCNFNRNYFQLKNCECICLLIYAEAIGDSWGSTSWSRGHAQRDETEGEIKYLVILVLGYFYILEESEKTRIILTHEDARISLSCTLFFFFSLCVLLSLLLVSMFIRLYYMYGFRMMSCQSWWHPLGPMKIFSGKR
jgi:hypothetical protein